jgi:uncharacterized protein (TIGR03000 family)
MFKLFLGATLALLLASGDVLAQRGHGGGRDGGGRVGGYRGGFDRGGFYGDRGFYGRGFYGGFYGPGWGWGGWGWPYYGYGLGYGYPYYSGYSYPNYYGSYPETYVIPGVTYDNTVVPSSASSNTIAPYSSNSTTQGDSSLSPPASPPAPLANQAMVTMLVPKGGQVSVNGKLIPAKSDGKVVFTTAQLDPGRTYVLDVRARWREGNQDQSYTIPLRVEAGDNMTMDLTNIH